ncbi:glycoprotein-N-acetylgalactosamine 3-beta-galactosyltransferase 1-like isoform X2 [Panulirus ornatus]|uniref:glycoprotein-N-acetylgalactosamine 3-beta-galactosyltransferase 1-like isoform X2 n=2 Tax=Panulirus ornatus TaxID=150431 RepID=UPI003A86C76C
MYQRYYAEHLTGATCGVQILSFVPLVFCQTFQQIHWIRELLRVRDQPWQETGLGKDRQTKMGVRGGGKAMRWCCGMIVKLGRELKRRPRFVQLLLVAVLIVTFLLHQFILLAQVYRQYILAVLVPEPPLPVQRRPTETDLRVDSQDHPRVLCLIVTSPKYHEGRAKHVAVTWATHCTQAIFLTTSPDHRLPHVLLTPGAVTYDQLWSKVVQGFEWAYEHQSEFDWVVKADDDTFLVVENLQAAVRTLDPNQPQATGVHLHTWETGSTYLNGGAGYVLSRGAVTKLVEDGLKANQCHGHLQLGTKEDVNMALCLSYLGVVLLDSRDSLGRQRFHVYPPMELIDPRQADNLRHLWLKQISVFPYKFGYSELSDEVISFHYIDAHTMYCLYYLIYYVNPALTPGRSRNTFPSPPPIHDVLPSQSATPRQWSPPFSIPRLLLQP